MTMLWPLFIVLILASLGVLLLPFLRNRAGEAPERVAYDMVVYRSQLVEIDQEIGNGLLTPEQAEAARAEVHRRMLVAEDAELDAAPLHVSAGARRYHRTAMIACAVILPVGAAVLYGLLGSPGLPGRPYAWRLTHDPEFVSASSADKLAALLQERPTAAGYKKLGEMYFDAREFGKAADADRHAIALGAADSATWSELGESVVMANGGAVVPEALMAFTDSLGIDPASPRSRFYIGLAESQIGNLEQAVGIWRDLEKSTDPNASWRPLVEAHITAVAKRGGFDPQTVVPQPPSVQALNVALKAMTNAMHLQAGVPPAPQVQSTADMPPGAGTDDQNTMIRAMVARFAERMKGNPNDKAGWERLAHAYTVLGEGDKAREAAEHAAKIQHPVGAGTP